MVSLTDYVKLLEGLGFPYDWSNPQIADEVQIAKVLDKARFDDISRTTAPYGLPLVELVAWRFGIDLGTGPLGAIMPSIHHVSTCSYGNCGAMASEQSKLGGCKTACALEIFSI